MRSCFFAFGLILFNGIAYANEPKTNAQDHTKYCYLDGKAYSIGSRVVKNNEIKQCKRIDGINLDWDTPD